MASDSRDDTISLWDVTSRQPLGPFLTSHKPSVPSVALSPDGQTLALGSDDSTVVLWGMNLESWQDRTCIRANRNLPQEERRQIFGDEPYRATCPYMPVPHP